MSEQDDELFELATIITDSAIAMNGKWVVLGEHAAEDVLAAGYRKPRTITTPDEANALPDRSAFVTPGEIIFRKWENYYDKGKHAWERELGQMLPAELLSAEGHFPATVLWEPAP